LPLSGLKQARVVYACFSCTFVDQYSHIFHRHLRCSNYHTSALSVHKIVTDQCVGAGGRIVGVLSAGADFSKRSKTASYIESVVSLLDIRLPWLSYQMGRVLMVLWKSKESRRERESQVRLLRSLGGDSARATPTPHLRSHGFTWLLRPSLSSPMSHHIETVLQVATNPQHEEVWPSSGTA
jgi:hypothetical protein